MAAMRETSNRKKRAVSSEQGNRKHSHRIARGKRGAESLRVDRQPLKTLLIVVEGSKGKSEQAYFQQLVRHIDAPLAVTTTVIPGEGEPSRVFDSAVNYIKKCGREFDYVCLVMDADEHAKLPEILRRSKQRRPCFYTAVTNPKFELWLLWHKEDQNASISGRDLDRRLDGLELVQGRNNKELHRRFPFENLTKALERACRAECWVCGPNPSSGIPWLIEAMRTGIFPGVKGD